MITQVDKDNLEQLIDQVGLPAVLTAIGEICSEKADHLRTNWQDVNMAREWDRSARKINSVAAFIAGEVA